MTASLDNGDSHSLARGLPQQPLLGIKLCFSSEIIQLFEETGLTSHKLLSPEAMPLNILYCLL